MEHLRYLRIFNFVMGALFVLGGLIGAGAMTIPVALAPRFDEDGPPVALAFVGGLVLLLVLVGVGVLYFVTGNKVAHGRWRIVQTILAVLALASFPVGTAYGGYALWVCWMNEETKGLFL